MDPIERKKSEEQRLDVEIQHKRAELLSMQREVAEMRTRKEKTLKDMMKAIEGMEREFMEFVNDIHKQRYKVVQTLKK